MQDTTLQILALCAAVSLAVGLSTEVRSHHGSSILLDLSSVMVSVARCLLLLLAACRVSNQKVIRKIHLLSKQNVEARRARGSTHFPWKSVP
jgi:hypothetical protein